MGNKSSSQLGNHRGGRDKKNHEGMDLHEKVEGLSTDNNPKGGDPHVAKQTSDDKGWFSIFLLNLSFESWCMRPKLCHSNRSYRTEGSAIGNNK